MIRGALIAGLLIIAIFICGCSGPSQDDDFKKVVQQVANDFKDQKDLIVKPNQGIPVAQLDQYRSAAKSAISTVEGMKLSDKYGKARGIFVTGMNATVTAIDTMQDEGKLSNPSERVTTESVSGYFITTQTKLDDTCDMLGIEKEKAF